MPDYLCFFNGCPASKTSCQLGARKLIAFKPCEASRLVISKWTFCYGTFIQLKVFLIFGQLVGTFCHATPNFQNFRDLRRSDFISFPGGKNCRDGWSGGKISPHLAPLESRLLRPLWRTSRAVLPLVENWVKETQPKLAKVHSTSWKPGPAVYVQRDSWTGAWKVAQWKNCSSPKTGDLCTVYICASILYLDVCICVYIYIYVCMCICIYVYMCICIYVRISNNSHL